MAALSFEERLALLVDREIYCRNDRKLARLLKNAQLKYTQAAIEDIDARAGRGIDRREVMSLALGDWVTAGRSVLITWPTGAGKSWLACARPNMRADAVTYPCINVCHDYRKNCAYATAAVRSGNGYCRWQNWMY